MKFEECVLRSHATGSRYICNPAPTDTDKDTIFLVNGFYDYETILLKDGWEDCGKDYNGSPRVIFRAFRKGEENYIVTEDPYFYLCYLKATEGAKALNLLNKEDRIKLFEAVYVTGMAGLYDIPYDADIPQFTDRFAEPVPEPDWHRDGFEPVVGGPGFGGQGIVRHVPRIAEDEDAVPAEDLDF